MRRHIRLELSVLMLITSTAWGRGAGEKISAAFSATPQPHVTITNNYSSPVTGIIISTDLPRPGGKSAREVTFLDTGINWMRDRALAPGKSRTFNIGHSAKDPTVLQPRLMAAVFDDGTSYGDPSSVATIRARWQTAYDEIAKVTTLLQSAGAEGETKDEVLASLQHMRAALGNDPTLERPAADLVLYMAISNIQRGGVPGDLQRTMSMILGNLNAWQAVLGRRLGLAHLSG